MSARTEEQIKTIINWFIRVTLAVSAFLLSTFFYEIRADVKLLLNENAIMKVEVEHIKHTIERIEDSKIRSHASTN